MTTVAVLCDPPDPGLVLEGIVETSPLSAAEAADLYAALLRDSAAAVERSGGELLVNYRDRDDAAGDAASRLSDLLTGAVDVDAARFEPQVGETFAGRAGNTATHLLEKEGVASVAVVRPEAALLARTDVDGAAMKLRSSEVVLGPAPCGRVYYAGFADPIDFADAYAPPAVETLTDRALAAGHGVDFLAAKPYVETGSDLADVVATVRARLAADALVPPHLGEWVAESGFEVEATSEGLALVR